MTAGAHVAVPEAGVLVQVLADHAAREAGVRLLAIKGQALAVQGLREERVSADVDVLVDPVEVDRFVTRMEGLGWCRGPVPSTPPLAPRHAVDMVSDLWPVGVDVHHQFPGFLADPEAVFDALWRRRVPVVLGGVEVWAPSPAGHAEVVALHYLREPWREGVDDRLRDLAACTRAVLGDDGLRELETMAVDTGSVATLRRFLEPLGIAALDNRPDSSSRRQDWDRRTREELASMPWLMEVRRTPWRRKARVIVDGLSMPEDELRRRYDAPAVSLWRLHARRAYDGGCRYLRAGWGLLRTRWGG